MYDVIPLKRNKEVTGKGRQFDPFKEVDRLFESAFRDFPMTFTTKTAKYPPVNIISHQDKDGNTYDEVTMALAGFQKENLTIAEQEGKIVVSGTSSFNEEVKDAKVHTQEIAFRNFSRSFTVEGDFEVKDAEFKDGLLKFKVYVKPPNETKKLVDIR